MVIGNDFYLHGFIRQDKGEAGAVFVRYAAPTEAEGKLRFYTAGKERITTRFPFPSPLRLKLSLVQSSRVPARNAIKPSFTTSNALKAFPWKR